MESTVKASTDTAVDSGEVHSPAQGFKAPIRESVAVGGASVGATSPAVTDFPTGKTTLEGMLPGDASAVAWARLNALATSAGSAGIRDLFESFDTDGSGTLDKNEFKAALASVGLPGASNKVVEMIMKAASQEVGAKGSKKALDYATFATALQPAAIVPPAPAAAFAVAGVGESKSGMDDEILTTNTPSRDIMHVGIARLDASASTTAATTDALDEKPRLTVNPSRDLSAGASTNGAGGAAPSPPLLDSSMDSAPINKEVLDIDPEHPRGRGVDFGDPDLPGSLKDTSASSADSDPTVTQARAAWEAAAREPALQQFAALLARGVPPGQVVLAMNRAGSYNPAVVNRLITLYEAANNPPSIGPEAEKSEPEESANMSTSSSRDVKNSTSMEISSKEVVTRASTFDSTPELPERFSNLLRIGAPPKAVASRMQLEGLDLALYDTALFGHSARKPTGPVSPRNPKRFVPTKPNLVATLGNGNDKELSGRKPSRSTDTDTDTDPGTGTDTGTDTEEDEESGKDMGAIGGDTGGKSVDTVKNKHDWTPLVLMRVRRDASADFFSPADALVLTAPLWVPDLTLGDGRVVESLKLRVPLNSMRSSLQSWPVSGAHSTAATFDFAAPTAPASFSVAATSATRNSALPRASNTPRDSAHASSLLGLRASAVLLVSCGDFRKELVRTEDNADNKSCSCCSSPHSNNETTVDPGLTSIFPAVRRQAKRLARIRRRANRRFLLRVGQLIARAASAYFAGTSPTTALVVLLVDPMPELVPLASAILRAVAPPGADWCIVEVDALASDSVLQEVISQRLQALSTHEEVVTPTEPLSNASNLAADLQEDAAASLLVPTFASPWPMPFPYQSSHNQTHSRAAPDSNNSNTETMTPLHTHPEPTSVVDGLEVDDAAIDEFVQRWVERLAPPIPQPVSEVPPVPPSSSSRAERLALPVPSPPPPSAPGPAPPPPPAPMMAPGAAAITGGGGGGGGSSDTDGSDVEIEGEYEEEDDQSDASSDDYGGAPKDFATTSKNASDATDATLKNTLATVARTMELAKEMNKELSTQSEALSDVPVPKKGRKGGATPRRASRNLVDLDSAVGQEDSLAVKLQNLQPPQRSARREALKDELNETKNIMADSIAKVIDRGESLDDLVDKSEDLAAQSRSFMKQAKKKKGKMLSLPPPSFKRSAPTPTRRREPQQRQPQQESEEILAQDDPPDVHEDSDSDVADAVLFDIAGDTFGGIDLSNRDATGGATLDMPMLPAESSDDNDDADASLQSDDEEEEEVMPTNDAREVELVPFRGDDAITENSLEDDDDLPQNFYLEDIGQAENISQPLNFRPKSRQSAVLSAGRVCVATASAASRQVHHAILATAALPKYLCRVSWMAARSVLTLGRCWSRKAAEKKRPFDDLFADQETAFKYLAELVACCLPTTDRAFYRAGLAPPLPGPDPSAPSKLTIMKAACVQALGCSKDGQKEKLLAGPQDAFKSTTEDGSQFNDDVTEASFPWLESNLGLPHRDSFNGQLNTSAPTASTKSGDKGETKDRAKAEAMQAWNLRAATRATWEKAYSQAQVELASVGGRGGVISGYCRIVAIWSFGLALAAPLVFAATLILFLPAFFLLLLVRSNTVESDDTKFVVRAEKIKSETKAKHRLRMCRFLGRTVPMFALATLWPLVMVIVLLPRLPYATGQTLLACHFGLLVAFQTLGTVRAGQSWLQAQRAEAAKKNSRDEKKEGMASATTAVGGGPFGYQPDLYNSNNKSNRYPRNIVTGPKAPRRASTEVWPALSVGNLEIGASLLLEFVQMASFPFQGAATSESNEVGDDGSGTRSSNNHESGGDDDGVSTNSSLSSMAPEWMQSMHGIAYVTDLSPLNRFFSSFTIPTIDPMTSGWCAALAASLLVVLIAVQFLIELRSYGLYLQHGGGNDKAARDYFFSSLTGAVVYGHGQARWVSSATRKCVALLADSLYITVSFQLARVLTCAEDVSELDDFDPHQPQSADIVLFGWSISKPVQPQARAYMLADPSVACWEGQHLMLASVAAVGLTFYVSLSVMLAPMMMANQEQDPQENNDDKQSTSEKDSSGDASSSSRGRSNAARNQRQQYGERTEVNLAERARWQTAEIQFVKPYQMLTVLVKTAMLLAAALSAARNASSSSLNDTTDSTDDTSRADADAAVEAFQLSNGVAALASSAVLLATTAAWVLFAHKLATGEPGTPSATTMESSLAPGSSLFGTPKAKKLLSSTTTSLSDFLPCKVTAVNRWKVSTFAAASASAGLAVWAAERDVSPSIENESGSSGSSSNSLSGGNGYPTYVWHTNPAEVPSADFITGWLPVLWAALAVVALGWPTIAACATAIREGMLDAFCRDYDPCDPDSDEEDGGEEMSKSESIVSARLLAAALYVPPDTLHGGDRNGHSGDTGTHIFVDDTDESPPAAYDQPFAILGRWLSI